MKFRYQKLPFRGHDTRKPFVARPLIPVYLHGKERSARRSYYALLDSGADTILFPAELAYEIGITDLTQGRSDMTMGIGGQTIETHYFDDLGIEVVGYPRKLPATIGFSKEIFIPILGRSFFLHFKAVIFSETKEEVELKI